jgi:hypothetical protein
MFSGKKRVPLKSTQIHENNKDQVRSRRNRTLISVLGNARICFSDMGYLCEICHIGQFGTKKTGKMSASAGSVKLITFKSTVRT